MPVWHEMTKELRATGQLHVVGIVQEQHADRAQLYAQWQGLDFPILWDPFNTLGVEYVLIASYVDEHGVVREVGLSEKEPDRLRALLQTEWEPLPEGSARRAAWLSPEMAKRPERHPLGTLAASQAAMARVMWPAQPGSPDRAALNHLVHALEYRLQSKDAVAADHFRAGVARRWRLDAGHGRPGDLQASLDHWVQALSMNPNQYIWRRRIQQWGPRLDKPYPFYDWVEQAYADLKARGVEFPELSAMLTGSEVAGRSATSSQAEGPMAHPDPEGKVLRDTGQHVRVEVGVAPHSKTLGKKSEEAKEAPPNHARVHVSLDPRPKHYWTSDADAPLLWVDWPEGVSAPKSLPRFRVPAGEAPTQTLVVDFELSYPALPTDRVIEGFVLYSICDDEGVCLFRRQDLQIRIPAQP